MKNTVELIGWYGGDEAIACSAWTSTSRDLTDEKRQRIPALLKQLWNAKPVPHGTPFEKGIVHFLVDSDIASHIHLIKHRLASINGESARYKELKEDKYYIPKDWEDLDMNDKAGGCSGNIYDNISVYRWARVLKEYTEEGNKLYHKSLAELTPILGRKRAKETARYFKTYNSQIQCDVMMNMRCFHNFYTQRADDHAQIEIQDIAKQMLQEIRNIPGEPFKYTLEAFGF